MKPRTERRAPRLQLGYSFQFSIYFAPVHGSLREFYPHMVSARLQAAFFRVLLRIRMYSKQLTRHYDLSIPKPKVGGSTPSGTAIPRMRSNTRRFDSGDELIG